MARIAKKTRVKKTPAKKRRGGAAAEKAKQAAAARREAARLEKEQARQEAVEAATAELEKDAKEIKVRLEKVEKMEGQADNHRVAIAYRLAEAKKAAKTAGVAFKNWCESELGMKYERVRKLAVIGERAKDEAEAFQLIQDLREGTAARVKKAREKKKQEEAKAGKGETVDAETGETHYTLTFAKSVFDNLKPEDQQKFASWVAKQIAKSGNGASRSDTENEDDTWDIPDDLKRTEKTAKPRKRRVAAS